MPETAIVTEMTLRDLWRRRPALILLFLLPLAFYLARRNDTGEAVRFVSLGLAWTVATAALFSTAAAKPLEPRLRLSGYRTRQLLAGRLLALVIFETALATVPVPAPALASPLPSPLIRPRSPCPRRGACSYS